MYHGAERVVSRALEGEFPYGDDDDDDAAGAGGKGGTVPVVNRVTIYPGHNAGLLESGIICRGTNARGNSFHERLRRIDFRVSRTFFPRHRSRRASHSSRSRRVSSHFFLSSFSSSSPSFSFPAIDGRLEREKKRNRRRRGRARKERRKGRESNLERKFREREGRGRLSYVNGKMAGQIA